jgi:hypothetical protein
MTAIDPQIASSTEFVEVVMTYKVAEQLADPTTNFTGYMSFKTSKDDEPGHDFTNAEWHAAAWVVDAPKPTLELRLGPKYSGVVLAPGIWHVFVAADDGATEAPVIYAGTRKIK